MQRLQYIINDIQANTQVIQDFVATSAEILLKFKLKAFK